MFSTTILIIKKTVYGSVPDSAKTFGFFRIRARNTGWNHLQHLLPAEAGTVYKAQSWAFGTFFPFRYSLIRYFNVAIRYRYSATFQKFAIRYSLYAIRYFL
jgi:hypothetical protein